MKNMKQKGIALSILTGAFCAASVIYYLINAYNDINRNINPETRSGCCDDCEECDEPTELEKAHARIAELEISLQDALDQNENNDKEAKEEAKETEVKEEATTIPIVTA